MSHLRGLLSTVRRALPKLLGGREVVGRDALGNTYYRWTEKDLEGADWERREVRLAKGLTYDADVLPPEWTQWLRKARSEPPSPEEVAKNKAAREQVRMRAAAIAAADARRAHRAAWEDDEAPASDADFIRQITSAQADPNKQGP